jgi:hypothetical protein
LINNVIKLNNIFTENELKIFFDEIKYTDVPTDSDGKYLNSKDNNGVGIDNDLGRLQFKNLSNLPQNILDKVNTLAKQVSDKPLSMSSIVSVEYSGKYGTPNLPVHYDHDSSDLIVNFQLSSNTSWGLGIDLNLYSLEDNSAIIFNPNEYTHWRPKKIFTNEEYIKMIFFRFINLDNPSDYSHLDYTIGHEIFSKIEAYRDSLSDT